MPSNEAPREPTKRRYSAEGARDQLCRAVVKLMATRSVAGMSVREIAKEAGVAHGLVHRYFGSKEALVLEAARRRTQRFHDEDDGSWTALRFLQRLSESPEIATIIARCCLDGPREVLEIATPLRARWEAQAVQVGKTLERFGISIDANSVIGFGCVALLGWKVFRPFLESTGYLSATADEDLATLAGMLDQLSALGAIGPGAGAE